MTYSPLKTRIAIDHVLCHEQGDGVGGNAEPYLWALFFKVDGDTVEFDAQGHLRGTCTLVPADGTRGNLKVRSVDDGQTVLVPSGVGERLLPLTPIPDRARVDQNYSGVVGVLTYLREEDRSSVKAVRAGYDAFIDATKKELDRLIAGRVPGNVDLNDDEAAALVKKAKAAVTAAVKGVDGAGGNPDDTLGIKLFKVSHESLANNFWDLTQRFPANGFGDWELRGEAQGVVASQARHTHRRLTELAASPLAASAPAIVRRHSGGPSVVYRDRDQQLYEIARGATVEVAKRHLNLGEPKAAGQPFAYVDPTTGVEIVLYRGADRRVYAVSWQEGEAVHIDNLSDSAGTGIAAGDPVGLFNAVTNTNHVVYQTNWGGAVQDLYWSGAQDPVHKGQAFTVAVAGRLSAYHNVGGGNVLVFRDAQDGHVHSLPWTTTGRDAEESLSAVAQTPPAAGDPGVCYIAALDRNQVVYRAADQHLYELAWRGVDAVVGRDLTTQSGAPLAEGDPVVFHHAPTNTMHVVYRGPHGHLFEIWWVVGGTGAVLDLSLAALAPRAADHPAGLSLAPGNTLAVVYRGLDAHVHEIAWS